MFGRKLHTRLENKRTIPAKEAKKPKTTKQVKQLHHEASPRGIILDSTARGQSNQVID